MLGCLLYLVFYYVHYGFTITEYSKKAHFEKEVFFIK